MTDGDTGQSSSRGRLAPSLAVVGAALLILAALTTSWWRTDVEESATSYRVGLVQAEICHQQTCQSRRLSGLGLWAPWVKTAAAVFACSMVVAGLTLLLAVVMPGAGWRRNLAWVVAVITLFSAVLMIVAHVLIPFDEVHRGWSLMVAFSGLAVCLLAAGLRLVQPMPTATD